MHHIYMADFSNAQSIFQTLSPGQRSTRLVIFLLPRENTSFKIFI